MTKRKINLAENQKFWMAIRQAFLMMVDAIERRPDIQHKPRTAQLRGFWKGWKKEQGTNRDFNTES